MFSLNSLKDSGIFPALLWNINIAILTILIPLAIAILGDILDKKRHKKADFAELDLHVILDGVFQFKELLVLVVLIYFPFLFWQYPDAKMFIFSYWVIGMLGVIKIILNIYNWVKGNVFNFRFQYLKKCTSCKDLTSVWPSVWRVSYSEGGMDSRSEKVFFDIFSETIDKLLKKKHFSTIVILLDSFLSFIDNRSIELLVVEENNFLKIMQWHFKIWCEKKESKEEKRLDLGKILNKLTFIIKKIEERALQEGEDWPFFKSLKTHIQSTKGKPKYIEDLLSRFCSLFFTIMETIKSPMRREDIWNSFPDEWKITKDNYKRYLESRIFWRYFIIKWVRPRIQYSKKDYDEFLDEVIKNLFPEVEPMSWAGILLFVYSPYAPEKGRIRSIIEKKWHFGRYIGAEVSSKEAEKWLSEQSKKTYELALLLFKDTDIFTKENLEKYIKELKYLESTYNKNSTEEKHRLELLKIFEGILKCVEEKE